MRKLVTAACALAAGIALADVPSSNVVGFKDISADANVYTPMAIMFTDTGVTTLAITNIVFDGIARGDNIQIFGNDGNVATTLEWVRERVNGQSVYKWNDASYAFQLGDAFWLLPQGDVTTKIPGEVKESDLTINAPANVYTPMGNGTAAPVAITDITFDGIQRGDNIQIFGNDGNVATTLEWVRERVNGQSVYKWNDETYVFQPGDAFWLLPQSAVTVTFPAPTIGD